MSDAPFPNQPQALNPAAMEHPAEATLRRLFGQSLQAGAARAVLALAAFSFLGALVAYIIRRA